MFIHINVWIKSKDVIPWKRSEVILKQSISLETGLPKEIVNLFYHDVTKVKSYAYHIRTLPSIKFAVCTHVLIHLTSR